MTNSMAARPSAPLKPPLDDGVIVLNVFNREALCKTRYRLYRVFQKKVAPPPKTFRNIFTSVKSFCVKFCKFVSNSYPQTSTNFF